jgi:translation initiation factor IF-3
VAKCHAILLPKEEKLIPHFNPNDRRRPEKRFDPINEHIRYPEVLVIGPNGEQLGVMSSQNANKLAMSYDLDLFCVAPNAKPPVCKILNYGKYRFEQQKQQKASKKNQKTTETKEVQLTPVIGQHDLETKARKAREFIENGNKVNCCVYFRGRQLSHKEVGEDVMNRFLALLEDVSSIDKAPFWEEKRYTVILAPSKKKQEKKNAENEN